MKNKNLTRAKLEDSRFEKYDGVKPFKMDGRHAYLLIEKEEFEKESHLLWVCVLLSEDDDTVAEIRKSLGYRSKIKNDEMLEVDDSYLPLIVDNMPVYLSNGLPVRIKDGEIYEYPVEYTNQIGTYSDRYLKENCNNSLVDQKLDLVEKRTRKAIIDDLTLLGDGIRSTYRIPSFIQKEVSFDLSDVVKPFIRIKRENGEVTSCYLPDVLRAPRGNRFENRLSVPESEGRILTAVVGGELKELFILESSIMNYEKHKQFEIEGYPLYGESEGLVEEVEQVQTDFKMVPGKFRVRPMTKSSSLEEAATKVNAQTKETGDSFGVVTIEKGLFYLDDEYDAALVNLLDTFEERDNTTPGSAVSNMLGLPALVANYNSEVAARINKILLDIVNKTLRVLGALKDMTNLNDLGELKTLTRSIPKAKSFIIYLANVFETLDFTVDVDEEGKKVLFMTEEIHIVDGGVESGTTAGYLSPHLSPDAYKQLSRASLSVKGCHFRLYSTTDDPSTIVEFHAHEIETGVGDAGIYITDVIHF